MQTNEDISPSDFEKSFNETDLTISKTDLWGKTTKARISLSATVGEPSAATSEFSANNSPNQLVTGHALFLTWPPVVSTSSKLGISSKQYE